jgi:hypothetical protein
MRNPRQRLPLAGIVTWTEDLTGKRQQAVFLLGITELKTRNKKTVL